MTQLIECVPNFSEGNDLSVIRQITDEIETVEGIRLLDVDPGQATNRTVVTFVGSPREVVEAAVRGLQRATELIDMRDHHGEHPRFGATDVCPMVPVSGISMEETVRHARELARRLGEEIGLTVYCYESAAFSDDRRNLAAVRAGEYEGLKEKLSRPGWKPDFGPAEFNPRSGATAVGARGFLVAYNVNLNTTSTRRANAIAFDVREKGRIKREGNPLTGKIVREEDGTPVSIPGTLKCVKGIGWFIEEYGVAQISMNLTNISVTPVHVAFDEVCRKARARGVRVTGSEIVGLIPLKAVLDAGRHYLRKQPRSLGIPDREIIKIACKSLGLDDLEPFKPEEKIIEYVLADQPGGELVQMPVRTFVEETASESPAPGGGSIAASMGAMGAALATMVANLSSHKPGWDERWEEFSDWAVKGRQLYDELLRLVDEDTRAFNGIIDAYRLPQGTETEKQDRDSAVQAATLRAIEVPFQVMEQALASMRVIRVMAQIGNPNSVSDAAVGALCARSAVVGAFLNVKINSGDLSDQKVVEDFLTRGREMEHQAVALEAEILGIVDQKMQAS